jgi:tripartite-type tricarboxylate transporter receptor subunit TctC
MAPADDAGTADRVEYDHHGQQYRHRCSVLGAPRNTPAETIDALNKEINAALADPNMKARLADLGGTVLAGFSADFGKLIVEETEKWGKVIRAANIKPE